MYQYSFVTEWTFESPLENVWNEIRDVDRWPDWWKYVKSVELIKNGGPDEIGTVRRITWSTALPYTLSFDTELTHMDPFRRMEGIAHGELSGKGIWTFAQEGDKTHVRYDWEVRTTKQWMNLLAPIARPLFHWNHDKVMNAGYTGLKKRLKG